MTKLHCSWTRGVELCLVSIPCPDVVAACRMARKCCRACELDMVFLAGRLIEEMRSGADPETDPRDLTNKQILMLHQLLHAAKFSDPSGNHLSPAGDSAAPNVSLARTGSCLPAPGIQCLFIQMAVLGKQVTASCRMCRLWQTNKLHMHLWSACL